MNFLGLIFICFLLKANLYHSETIVDQVKQIISNNPSLLESINQSQIINLFSKNALLTRYLKKKTDGSATIDWNKFFDSSFGQNFINKITNERKIINKRSLSDLFDLIADFLKNLMSQLLAVPTCEKIGLRYSTNKTKLPDEIIWSQIVFAKELLNNLNKKVIVAGGNNPIDNQKWEQFKPFFPYQKNINRNLIFKKTSFIRSPDTDASCKNESCLRIINYKDYSWIELAKIVCMMYIPSKVDTYNPPPGYLISTTINKCQAVFFEKEIYQLDDGRGNFYVMHAFESNGPRLDVDLPNNWTLKRINISEPLVLSPFGSNNECYFNILRDSLGQGYHQYIYADSYYPN